MREQNGMKLKLKLKLGDLRKRGTLSPNGAVMADDSSRGELIAFYIAHQVLIYVSLPRHPLLFSVYSIRFDFVEIVLCVFFLLLCVSLNEWMNVINREEEVSKKERKKEEISTSSVEIKLPFLFSSDYDVIELVSQCQNFILYFQVVNLLHGYFETCMSLSLSLII